MDKESFEEFKRLDKELNESPGWKWEQRILINLGSSFRIFQGNRNELCKLIKWYEKGEQSCRLTDVTHRIEQDAFLYEVIRLFHNYLASVASLRDHTRTIMREFNSEGYVFQDYSEKLHSSFGSPESQFVQQSRNYMLHKTCIFTGSRLEDKNGVLEMSITFSLKELKDWDGWNAESKKYIKTQTENPRLLPLIENYSKNVDEFYIWFAARMTGIHKESLEKANEIKDKMRSLWEIDFPKGQ